ncbi:butyrophilin-like protein 2 isoform 2-T2 [Menidia menidia]
MAALRSLSFCLLAVGLLLPAAASTEQRILAEAGQDSVTLPCGAGKETEIRAVEWNRADLWPDAVLFYRDGLFESDRQHPSFRNRVDLQDREMKDGNVSLILKNVTIKDAGTYGCRVLTQSSSSAELISIVYLVVSPPVLRITAEAGQDSVTLPCGAGKETEIRAVDWNRDNQLQDTVLHYINGRFESDRQHPSFKNRVDLQDRQMKDGDVSLILKNVKINDTGTYLCNVLTQHNFEPELISTINLEVSPPPGQRITAEAGQDSVTLPCGAGKETEIRAVEWFRLDLDPDTVLFYRDGHFESDYQHPSFRNRVDLQDRQMKDGDVSLILKNVKINDTGTYQCKVYQGGIGLELISSIHLEVSSPGTQEGGGEEGGDEEGGDKNASLGLTAGLPVSLLCVLVFVLL